jgi:hypothetical protein
MGPTVINSDRWKRFCGDDVPLYDPDQSEPKCESPPCSLPSDRSFTVTTSQPFRMRKRGLLSPAAPRVASGYTRSTSSSLI